jgi:hypothetical protein
VASITNIVSVIKGASKLAEKKFKEQLNKRREGSAKRMNDTGSLRNSIKGEVVDQGGGRMVLTVVGSKYGAMLDKGITGAQIPYTQGSGDKGKNAYISALAAWCSRKFNLNKRNALLMAFRIARKRKYEEPSGAPQNKGWVEEIKKDVDRVLAEEFKKRIMIAINKDVYAALDKKINY